MGTALLFYCVGMERREGAGLHREMAVTCREPHFNPEEKPRLEGESTAVAERGWPSLTPAPPPTPGSRSHSL